MDIGKFVGNLITIGLILATLGTLSEVRDAFRKEAGAVRKQGMFSIGAFNRKLLREK